jgi:multiple sugar transport system substrate-binding protein
MKKTFGLIMIFLLVTCFIWSNGQTERQTLPDRELVTFLFWPGPESEAMQQVLDAYNANQGITDNVKVEMLLFSRQGFFDKLIADMAAGSSEFDLNLVTTYSLGRYVPYLQPLDSFIKGTPSETFIPASLNSLALSGAQYGVPTDVSLHFTFYRQDLIDELMTNVAWKNTYADISKKYLGKSLSPKDPAQWSWDDYLATALFFTKSINPKSPTQFGTVLQLKNLIFNIMIWQSTMVSNGGNWMDSNGTITINSEAAKKGLEVYQLLIDNKATPAGSINYEFAEANEAFKSGQAATMFQWNAAYSILVDPEQSPLVYNHIGVAPLPAGISGHKTHVHSLGIGMNASSLHKEAAGKFVNYLFTADAMEVYGRAGGAPPVSSVLSGLSDLRPEFPTVAQYLEEFAYVVNGGTADYAVPVYEVLAEEFSSVWAGEQSIEVALTNAEMRMEKLTK